MTLDEANAPGSVQPDVTQLFPVGGDGLLVRFSLTASAAATASVQVFTDSLRSAQLSGVTSFEPSLASVLLRFEPGEQREALMGEIKALAARAFAHDATPAPAERIWEIPVAFGGHHGPDLDAAAGLAGLRPEAAVEQILATPTRVLAIGFAPGQPYLGLLPEPWNLPRLQELTPQVPRGAIAVAVRQMVLFANSSPTGWRQIARTAFQPFRPDAEEPAPLKAGDEVRFLRATADELDALLAAHDPTGGARCRTRT